MNLFRRLYLRFFRRTSIQPMGKGSLLERVARVNMQQTTVYRR